MSNTQTKYHINDADQVVEANEYLLDVREPFEYEMGHIAEADNVSVNEIEERLEELPKDRKIHVYCQRGKRGANAVEILKRNGFDAVNLEEGYSAYTGKYDIADEAGETADAAVGAAVDAGDATGSSFLVTLSARLSRRCFVGVSLTKLRSSMPAVESTLL